MNKWLVASVFMLAVQANAEGMVMIDGSVDTTEIRALRADIKQLEVVIAEQKETLTRMSKLVNTPLKLAVNVIQQIEPGVYVATYQGESFILSSARIRSPGWFQQPIVRQRELIPMVMANGFTRELAHFVDINMDPNKYMEQEYKKIGFYERRESYWKTQDQLKEKQDQLASLEGE